MVANPLVLEVALERARRAEVAAAGSIKHLMAYVKAVDPFFKVWSDDASTTDEKIAALEAVRTAHNAALAWAKEESARVHDRTNK